MAKILVIDDVIPTLDTVAQMLKRGGHEVITATDGRKGVQLYKESSPDLVVTDLLMPEMDGLETIRELSKIEKNLPIIAISGVESDLYLQIAEKFGAARCIAKPFKQQQILSLVTESLNPSPNNL